MKKKKKTLIQSKEKKADSLIIVSKKPFNSLTQNSNQPSAGETLKIPSHIKPKPKKTATGGAGAAKSASKQPSQNINKRLANLQ